jgi:hypothetical protein
MPKVEKKLTDVQRLWLEALSLSPLQRIFLGGHGMPEPTAKALERRGLVRIEMQRIFLNKEGRSREKAYFVVLTKGKDS